MSNSIYTPITAPFANTEFVSIRVDNVDYYIVSQLPMDENGISGFQALQKTAQRDFNRILGKASKLSKFAITGVKAKVVCISHDALDTVVAHFAFHRGCVFAQALMRASFNTELRRANDYQRGCLAKEEFYKEWLGKVVKYFARKKDCNFCWDLLDASFDAELARINDSKWKCLKREAYYQSWVAKKGAVNRRNYTDSIKGGREDC